MDNKKIIIVPQPGCTVELTKLIETSKYLVEMGYTVRRIKIAREGQKTLINALEVQERKKTEEAGGNPNVD